MKDDANAVRRAVYNGIERHAIEHGLGGEYVGRFFLIASKRGKKAKANSAEGTAGPTEPKPG